MLKLSEFFILAFFVHYSPPRVKRGADFLLSTPFVRSDMVCRQYITNGSTMLSRLLLAHEIILKYYTKIHRRPRRHSKILFGHALEYAKQNHNVLKYLAEHL
mgnify:CR=1 FL=1